MQKSYSILTIVALTCLLFSCGQYPCARGGLRYNFVGFSDAESDTFIIRRFTRNSNIIKDSIPQYDAVRYNRSGDTLNMVAYLSNVLLQSDYDYQLFFPGANKTFAITEINEDFQNSGGGFTGTGEPMCINPVTSCKVDGQNVSLSFSTLYLGK
jgi:hypothetical protein